MNFIPRANNTTNTSLQPQQPKPVELPLSAVAKKALSHERTCLYCPQPLRWIGWSDSISQHIYTTQIRIDIDAIEAKSTPCLAIHSVERAQLEVQTLLAQWCRWKEIPLSRAEKNERQHHIYQQLPSVLFACSPLELISALQMVRSSSKTMSLCILMEKIATEIVKRSQQFDARQWYDILVSLFHMPFKTEHIKMCIEHIAELLQKDELLLRKEPTRCALLLYSFLKIDISNKMPHTKNMLKTLFLLAHEMAYKFKPKDLHKIFFAYVQHFGVSLPQQGLCTETSFWAVLCVAFMRRAPQCSFEDLLHFAVVWISCDYLTVPLLQQWHDVVVQQRYMPRAPWQTELFERILYILFYKNLQGAILLPPSLYNECRINEAQRPRDTILRNAATPFEKKFLFHMRHALHLPHPQVAYRTAGGIIDFVCSERRVAIFIEGASASQIPHCCPTKVYASHSSLYKKLLRLMGWRIFDVRCGDVVRRQKKPEALAQFFKETIVL